ncbi:tripartite tricarboxylate transporter TctB family protein [Bacillus sp. Marseille-P3661]|uniref:tripartite tricarboxylate transporter TctB family protein n=1 Tax=Bacillus sp. Marseille-P3661 TaxID=1936234 RepID=UPI0015E16324|nr:tripartite tricarboxylate transporter TctB family protein [Bacillus sp. Marseille-P3661]
MKVINYGISIAAIMLSIFAYFSSSGFVNYDPNDIGPSVFPKGISVFTIILAVLLAITTYFKDKDTSRLSDIFSKTNLWNVGKTFVLFIGYYVVMNFAGFIISSLLFLFVFFKVLEIKLAKNIITSVVTTGVVYYIFYQLLNVQLPSGIW